MLNRKLFSLLVVILMVLLVAGSAFAAGEASASYLSHSGDLTVTSGDTYSEALAAEDGKFVQLAPGSFVVMKFPAGSEATPDGTNAPDLRIATYDAVYPAEAAISVREEGGTWTLLGVFPDTANLDFDLDVVGIDALYVKIDQADHYIDPKYPKYGFDLNAVTALAPPRYGEITNPTDGSEVSGWVNFTAMLYNDDEVDDVNWAVHQGECSSPGEVILGNVEEPFDPYSWDGKTFSAGADTSTWEVGLYCFVFDPLEKTGEEDVREKSTFTIGEPEEGDFCEILWKPPIKLGNYVMNVKSTLPIKFFLADCDGKKIHGEADPELVVYYLGEGEDDGENPFPLDLKRGTGGYQFLALFRPGTPGKYEAVVTYLGGEWSQAFEVVEGGGGKDKDQSEEKLTGKDKDKPGKPESKSRDEKPRGKPGGKPGKDKEPKKP